MGILRDIGDRHACRRDHLGFLLAMGELRDLMRFRHGLSEFALVNHLDLIPRVLVTDAHCYGEESPFAVTRGIVANNTSRRFIGSNLRLRRR